MPIVSKEMGPRWGTSESDGPYARRFEGMSDDEREELGSGIVGAWNILADDRCSHHVFWTPSTSKIHVDEEEFSTPEEWDAWLCEVEAHLQSLAPSEGKDYAATAKSLLDWARALVDSTTGFAKNTDVLQGWLDSCDAVLSWTELSEKLIRFKYEPSALPSVVPEGVEFSSKGQLAQQAEEE